MGKLEIEIKLQVNKEIIKRVEAKLSEMNWALMENQFQRTYRCWRPDRWYSKHGIFPRTRMTQSLATNEKESRFTVKWKTEDKAKDFFVREEREIAIEDAKTCAEMLAVLGMSDQRILEKRRRVWTQGNWKTIITVDTLPFGEFIEIEGKKKTIEKLVKELGLENQRRWGVAYWDVYKIICEEQEIKEKRDLIF